MFGPGAAHLLVESVGGFEEADHGVEVAVGCVGFGARVARLGDPDFFEAAGFPEGPEHLGAGGVGSGEGLAARGEHGGNAVHGASYALFGQGFGMQQGTQQQVVAGAVAAGLQFDGTQLLAESPHVHAGCTAQPGGEQGDGAVRPVEGVGAVFFGDDVVEALAHDFFGFVGAQGLVACTGDGGVEGFLAAFAGVDEQAERVEEGAHGGFVAHGHEGGGGARGNTAGREHSADARHVRAVAHDDGALAVGAVAVDAFLE